MKHDNHQIVEIYAKTGKPNVYVGRYYRYHYIFVYVSTSIIGTLIRRYYLNVTSKYEYMVM